MPLHRMYSVRDVFSADDKKVSTLKICSDTAAALYASGAHQVRVLHRTLLFGRVLVRAVALQAIAERITKVYNHLPSFYVVVVFIDTDAQSFYIGGKPNDRFVRIVTQHLARA